MSRNSIFRAHRARVVYSTLVVVAVLGAPALGSTIILVSTNIQQTPIAFNNEWNMPVAPPAPQNNGSVLGEGPGEYWFINPAGSGDGQFIWTGSPLVNDVSTGGQANGFFGAGGEMTIIGKLFDYSVSPIFPIFEGVLFVGDVSDFQMMESAPDSNMVNLEGVATVRPTGGFLVTNGLGRTMPTNIDYLLSFTANGVQENGTGEINSWENNFVNADASEVTLAIPEPGAMLTLCGLLACALLRQPRRP